MRPDDPDGGFGPHRQRHVSRYRLRVDDELNLVYQLTRALSPGEYQFNIGDQLRIEGETLAGGDNDANGTDSGFDRFFGNFLSV